MFGYIYLFFGVFFISAISRYNKKIALFAIFIFMTLFVGLRYNVGTDYQNYSAIYDYEITYLEPGFVFLQDWLSTRHYSVTYLFFIMAFLTYGFLFWGLYKFKGARMQITMIMLCLCTLSFICNGIRQALAVAIFVFAYQFIENRKIIPFLLCVAGGFLFHTSILIVLPFFFVGRFRLGKIWYIALYAFSFIFIVMNLETLTSPFGTLLENYDRAEAYIEGNGQGEGYLGPGVILELLNCLILFIFSLIANIEKKYTTLFNIFFVGIVIMNMRVGAPIFVRVQMYFSIFTNFLLPIVIYESKDKLTRQLLSAYFILSLSASTIAYWFFTANSKMYPYRDVFGILG